MKMRAVWEIDVDAESPREAAVKSLEKLLEMAMSFSLSRGEVEENKTKSGADEKVALPSMTVDRKKTGAGTMNTTADSEKFSVAVFFIDGRWMYDLRHTDVETAMRKAICLSNGPGACLGALAEIRITDTMDCTALQWKRKEGCVFPPELKDKGLFPCYGKLGNAVRQS